jgi:hypothetical protein
MTDDKPSVRFLDAQTGDWLRREDVTPRACDECGAKLFPGDWLTRDGCCYCDAGLDLLTPWGAT